MKNHSLITTLKSLTGNPRGCVYTEPLWGIPFNLYAPYVSIYMIALGLSDKQIGLIVSVSWGFQIVLALLSGVVTFWFSPLVHLWSRRYEYQADAYAAAAMSEPLSLIGALRKLNEKNLSNLTPHPLYSGFYYSHPTLLEREAALTKAANEVTRDP